VSRRGISYIESMVVLAVIAVMLGAVVLPAYRSYSASRAPSDAAAALAEDLALLSRTAQNGEPNEGASLLIVSTDPLHYRGYRGRPVGIDPNSALGALVVERTFPGVVLAGGPISVTTPLLFASNGSAQYVSHGLVAGQHATVEFSLGHGPGGKPALVDLNLFTGSVTVP
jgi:type II secretory pathway pseudopilin PulG